MSNELPNLLSKSLENMKKRLLYLFESLNGFENVNNYCTAIQGLRPLGAEAILQSELYHSLRLTFSDPFIISREFKPFSKSDVKLKKGIDLAIFADISHVRSRPPEAKIWLELKMAGGKKYVKKAYVEDFNKLLEIARIFLDQNRTIPEIMGNIIFIESPKDTITKENPDDFLFGNSISSCLEAPSWFKNKFYEAFLWRERGRWILKPVFS